MSKCLKNVYTMSKQCPKMSKKCIKNVYKNVKFVPFYQMISEQDRGCCHHRGDMRM